MKIDVIILSIIATASTWWWLNRRHGATLPRTFMDKLKIAGQSLFAGIVVYFCLMLVIMLYLMIDTY
jgi:hypothetical protein